MDLGIYIKEKRASLKMSQRDLASVSGVSNAEISRIESGIRKSPSTSVLKSIADALRVPFEELLSDVGIISSNYSHNDSDISSATLTTEDSPVTTKNESYIYVGDLTTDEIKNVNQYILFIKSRRS